MHLWFTYKVLVQDGTFLLPALVEQRTVYWDTATTRSINGQPAPPCGDVWMCPSVPRQSVAPAVHRSIVADGWAIHATPYVAPRDALPTGRTIAIVLDRSVSMARHADTVEKAIAWLDAATFDARQIVYFGGQKAIDLLRQFETLRGDRRYDAILVLTDDGGFDLAAERETSLRFDTPVWMIHLGGTLPAGYDDAVLDAIERRGGGVAGSAREALQAIALRSTGQHIADGYLWSVEPLALSADYTDGFSALAARQFIGARTRSVDLNERTSLDALHTVAKNHAIVSPYSSMIVLVNDAQRTALDAAERRDDRFERETETGKEILTRPLNPFAAGNPVAHATPEPHEWLLIGAALMMLMYAHHRGWLVPAATGDRARWP
jgi:hypothetical protein